MSLLRTHRDFRLFWIGETINRFGSAISSVALPLVAISMLDATTFEVGLLTAAAWAPWLLIGLPTGAWIDRVRRRPLMLVSSAVSGLLLAMVPLAGLVPLAGDVLTIEFLLVIAGLVGAASVVFQTAYTAYLPTLLDPSDHAEGNAKLHGSASAAQIAGLGCGGLLVQFAGAANALFVDAASFLVALGCLAAIRFRERRTNAPRQAGAIREGIRLVAHDVWLRTLTIFGAVSNLALMGYQAIVVVFLVREAGLTAGTVGTLIAAASSGGVLGALVGRRTMRFGTARALLLCELGLPTLALLIPLGGASPWFYLVGAFGVSLGVVGGNVVKATFLQSYCPPDLFGRLTATNAFVNYGTIPLGALLGGTLGQTLGLTPALWITTAGVPLAGLVLLASPIRGRRDLPTHQGTGVPGTTADSSRIRTA
ncbi:putative MFS family arabinose efflux permease [Kribbella pratensis]|uniref:MFS family arabinose efflux permease n=1 Tax=Kribbella pratensis TaxID=2512112 RepID=A0ABY2FN28_9ACTN|nr:MFS transporter [Kribbella pratensis]TDW94531.1 putative MFS family arabinose efflux permease [Kribbella pratensis]